MVANARWMRRGGWLLATAALLLAVSLCASPVMARSGASAKASSRVSQSVLNSAVAEIQQTLALEAELNEAQGNTELPVQQGSAQDKELTLTNRLHDHAAAPEDKLPDAFAFLSEAEEPVDAKLRGVDVEQHLDSVMTELDSLFKTDSELQAEQQAKVEASLHTRKGRLAAKRAAKAARQAAKAAQRAANKIARLAARASHGKHMPASAPANVAAQSNPAASRRQQRLISRLDAYRSVRGHQAAPGDMSALEATAKAGASGQASQGYSLPSAFAPGAVPAQVQQQQQQQVQSGNFQGQVAMNPTYGNVANAGMWAALGLQPPTQPQMQPQQAPMQANAQGMAGVGALLAALKRVQQEQETNSLVGKLAALLNRQQSVSTQQRQMLQVQQMQAAQQQQMQQQQFANGLGMAPVAAAGGVPPVVASPFNYGQSLVATPVGYQNPNLFNAMLPGQQRLVPGQLPNQSPSYPTWIPPQNAAVGTSEEEVDLGHAERS